MTQREMWDGSWEDEFDTCVRRILTWWRRVDPIWWIRCEDIYLEFSCERLVRGWNITCSVFEGAWKLAWWRLGIKRETQFVEDNFSREVSATKGRIKRLYSLYAEGYFLNWTDQLELQFIGIGLPSVNPGQQSSTTQRLQVIQSQANEDGRDTY
jgi:hypothetical protein